MGIEDTAAFCAAESEAAVGVVEINMGADVVELLVPPEAVCFRSAPPMAVEMAVVSGVNVIGVLLFGGGELVGFDGLVECDVLRELAVPSTSAFFSLNMLAISPYNEVSSWAPRLDGNFVTTAWITANMGDSRATILETI